MTDCSHTTAKVLLRYVKMKDWNSHFLTLRTMVHPNQPSFTYGMEFTGI